MAMRDVTIYECDRCHRKVEIHAHALDWVLIDYEDIDSESIGEPTLLCEECYEDYCDTLKEFLTLNGTD